MWAVLALIKRRAAVTPATRATELAAASAVPDGGRGSGGNAGCSAVVGVRAVALNVE
jgi:hypothetical protein